MDNYIIRQTGFTPDPNGHGGNRRTAQITELVESAGLKIADLISNIQTNKWNRYLKGIQFIIKHKFMVSTSFRMVGICGHYYQIYHKKLSQHEGRKILLWEATNNYLLPYVAKELGFKIIAIPQNLESLVKPNLDPYSGQGWPGSFESEIEHLAKADAVFGISREEQWLLKLRGINADYLPYYPPEPILNNLLNLRQARTSSKKQRYLILGSAINPPTREGMIEQLQWLDQIRTKIDLKLDIAGYGTEQLKSSSELYNVTLHGSVTPDRLNQLLAETRVMLVHQKAGAGALMRIPEMVIAGIPVIANSNACRSAFNYPGVYCYDNGEELAQLMSKHLETPSILQRPLEAEKRFIDCLKQLA